MEITAYAIPQGSVHKLAEGRRTLSSFCRMVMENAVVAEDRSQANDTAESNADATAEAKIKLSK